VKSEKLSSLESSKSGLSVFNIPLSQVDNRDAMNNENRTDNSNLLTIVIPLKEDHRFLRHKSLLGLKETYFSDKVEIFLVDYGIKNMVDTTWMKELKAEYDNLIYYYYGDKELEL